MAISTYIWDKKIHLASGEEEGTQNEPGHVGTSSPVVLEATAEPVSRLNTQDALDVEVRQVRGDREKGPEQGAGHHSDRQQVGAGLANSGQKSDRDNDEHTAGECVVREVTHPRGEREEQKRRERKGERARNDARQCHDERVAHEPDEIKHDEQDRENPRLPHRDEFFFVAPGGVSAGHPGGKDSQQDIHRHDPKRQV